MKYFGTVKSFDTTLGLGEISPASNSERAETSDKAQPEGPSAEDDAIDAAIKRSIDKFGA